MTLYEKWVNKLSKAAQTDIQDKVYYQLMDALGAGGDAPKPHYQHTQWAQEEIEKEMLSVIENGINAL